MLWGAGKPFGHFSGVSGWLSFRDFGHVSLVVCRKKSDWPQAVPSSRRRRRRRLSGARVIESERLRQRRRRRRRRLSFVFRILVFPPRYARPFLQPRAESPLSGRVVTNNRGKVSSMSPLRGAPLCLAVQHVAASTEGWHP
jgi:hypothetical protein